jgi:predicted aspartyl protease
MSQQSFSRRRMVELGLASALLPSAAFGQSVRQAPTGSPEAAAIAAADDAVKHMTIGVMINGKGPFRFVVDTGADRSVLAESVAEALGLRRRKKVFVEGVVRTVPAETVSVENMKFGPASIDDMVLPVLPRAWLEADGYLGLDAISRYRIVLDFKHNELSADLPESLWAIDSHLYGGVMVNAKGSHGHLRMVNNRVDGVLASTFLDTGAAISVGNRALFDKLKELRPELLLRNRDVRISGVTGGVIDGLVMDFNRIKLGAITLTEGELVIADLQIFDIWGLTDSPALLIGMNFLRQFNRVTIDFGRKEYRFMVSSLYVAGNA